MKKTQYEQETIINYNQEEKTASVYTLDPALQRRMDKLKSERPEEVTIAQNGDYIIPKKWVKIAPPRTLNLTDEQRAELAERMRAISQAPG